MYTKTDLIYYIRYIIFMALLKKCVCNMYQQLHCLCNKSYTLYIKNAIPMNRLSKTERITDNLGAIDLKNVLQLAFKF